MRKQVLRHIGTKASGIIIVLLMLSGLAFGATGTSLDISRTILAGRTLGMGGAHLGLSNDGEGLFTNPSGLAEISYPQLMGFTRKIFYSETNYTLFSMAVPTNYGTFGIGYAGAITGNSLPTIRDPGDNRITVNPSIEAMSYENSTVLLSYSRILPYKNIFVGGNLKFITQGIKGGYADRASTTTIDLSASYRPLEFVNLGINLQNFLGGNLNWGNASEKIGGYIKLGGALNILGKNALYKSTQDLVGAFDLDIPRDTLSSALMHLGFEWTPYKMLAVRCGLNQENNGTYLTFGLGLKNTAFRFDYAYAQRPGMPGDNPHYFSLSYVGDIVVSTSKKVVGRESGITFINPKDKTVTTDEAVIMKAEAKIKNIIETTTTWTVPLVSATHESVNTEQASILSKVYQNGYPVEISSNGLIENYTPLNLGRNVIKIAGFTSNEAIMVSSEARIIRIPAFKDVPSSYWAFEPISLDSVLGLIEGYPNSIFKPEKGITRAELTSLLLRSANVNQMRINEARLQKRFKDIKEDIWYAPYVNIGAEDGLVLGYSDQTFKPNKILSRAEAITIMARFAKLPIEGTLSEKSSIEVVSTFKDLKLNFWANKYIHPAHKAGLLKYLEGKDFNHKKTFTRAEAAEVFFRTKEIQKRINEYWETGRLSTLEAR